LDAGVILFNAFLTLVAPLAFGMIPALASSRRAEHLRAHGDLAGRQTGLTRPLLVAGEVALSVLLVTGAGLLLRSLLHLERVDSGFEPEQAVSFSLFLPDARYPTEAQGLRTLQAIEKRLWALPGVQAVGAATSLALHGYAWTADATPEGRGRFPGDYERELRHNDITPGYFPALGARLLHGRFFDQRDTDQSALVTIVNEALEKSYFPGENAVGKRIKFGRPQDPVNKDAPWVTVVGVIADIKQDGLDKSVFPEAFTPLAQQPQNQVTFVLRGIRSPEILVAEARREVRAVDPQLVLTDVLPLPEVVRAATGDQRFRTSLLSAFAGIALFLAALGIYGVLAYAVTQRTKKIGVRLAVGASKQQLFRMVLHDGMRPVLAGCLLGLLGAGVTTSLLRSFLFGVTTTDPLTYGLTLAVIASVALGACVIPAWKAIQVDPLISLRDQ
jgi:putative ABC transport system permease protein